MTLTSYIVPAVHEAVYDGTVQYHTMLIISLLTSLLLYTRIPNFPTLLALGFRSDSPEWYDQLYRGLRMNAIVDCIKRGGKVTKKAVDVSKKAMRECLLFLLLQHNESLGYQERAIMFILYHAVGRGGDVDSSRRATSILYEEHVDIDQL